MSKTNSNEIYSNFPSICRPVEGDELPTVDPLDFVGMAVQKFVDEHKGGFTITFTIAPAQEEEGEKDEATEKEDVEKHVAMTTDEAPSHPNTIGYVQAVEDNEKEEEEKEYIEEDPEDKNKNDTNQYKKNANEIDDDFEEEDDHYEKDTEAIAIERMHEATNDAVKAINEMKSMVNIIESENRKIIQDMRNLKPAECALEESSVPIRVKLTKKERKQLYAFIRKQRKIAVKQIIREIRRTHSIIDFSD